MTEPAHIRTSWLHRYTAGGTPREDWRDRADCRGAGPDLWFPPASEGGTSPAVAVCLSCPVRLDCLQDAFAYERTETAALITGIRGGISATQRRLWLRSRPDVRPEGWLRRVEDVPSMVDAPNFPGQGRTHGRTGTYTAGCRCDLCREAMNAAQRRRRQKASAA